MDRREFMAGGAALAVLDQLAICDELGMMVMAESFDSWAEAKVENGYNLFFADWWRRDLENLVRKCRNHPSVVMWSIGNEITEQRSPSAAELSREMQALCHRFDPDPLRRNPLIDVCA